MYKKKLVYDHPVFDQDMIDAREKLLKFKARSYLAFGCVDRKWFHEDGFVSGKK